MEIDRSEVTLSPAARAAVQARTAPGAPAGSSEMATVHLLAGDRLDLGAVCAAVRAQVACFPALARRLDLAGGADGGPVWRDAAVDLEHHVRQLIGPIGDLGAACAAAIAEPLDEARPPWEVLVLPDALPGQHALIVRQHLALGADRSGLDLSAALLGLGGRSTPSAIGRRGPVPPAAARLGRQRAVLPRAQAMLRDARASVATPEDLGRLLVRRINAGRSLLDGVTGRMANRDAELVPPRVELMTLDLDAVRAVKDSLGVTVHDVLLGAVAGAVAAVQPDATAAGRWVRVLSPVVVAEGAGGGHLGVSAAFVTIPLAVDAPAERVEVVAEAVRDVRQTHRAVPASALTGRGASAPSGIHAAAARLALRAPSYDLLVTNVPGPRDLVAAFGARLVASWPLLPASQSHELVVACTSVAGQLCVAITGTAAVIGTGQLTDALAGALAELNPAVPRMAVRPPTAPGAQPARAS